MKIEEIKKLFKSGDVAGAAEAAEELLKGDPDNVQAMMLFGTCRQLQGDEATFRDTYRVVKDHLDAQPDALDAETKAAWQRFGELYAKLDQPELRRRGSTPRKSAMLEYAIIAAVIVVELATGIWLFGSQILGMFQLSAYAGPAYDPNYKGEIREHVESLYGGPSRDEFIKQATTEDGKVK